MIQIRDFDEICKTIMSEIADISSYLLSPTEEHIVKKLKDKTDIILVAVIPSGESAATGVDNYKDINTTYFFVVKKEDPTNSTQKSELDDYEKTQNCIESVKKYLIEKKSSCQFLRDVDINSFHIDPEYRIFGGFCGWSLSFDFKSNGY